MKPIDPVMTESEKLSALSRNEKPLSLLFVFYSPTYMDAQNNAWCEVVLSTLAWWTNVYWTGSQPTNNLIVTFSLPSHFFQYLSLISGNAWRSIVSLTCPFILRLHLLIIWTDGSMTMVIMQQYGNLSSHRCEFVRITMQSCGLLSKK